MLEDQLTRIAAALERIASIMSEDAAPPAKPKLALVSTKAEHAPEPAPEPATPSVTRADIKALCLSLSRSGTPVATIKAVLATFGAKTTDNLETEDLQACKEALEGIQND